MLKKETIKTATTVVVGFGLALLIVDTSPSFQACVHEHQNHGSDGALQEYIGRLLTLYETGRGCGGEWLHKHGEGVIALFTVILGIATWLLWRSTKRLVEGAEKSSERQLRAYVMVDVARIDDLKVGEKPKAHLTFKNSGQTPARELTHWCAMGFDKFPLTMEIKARDTVYDPPPRPLAPQGIVHTWADEKRTLNQETMNALMSGTYAVYVVGQIRYLDAFDIRRETDFLMFAGGPIGVGGELASYQTGNRIT